MDAVKRRGRVVVSQTQQGMRINLAEKIRSLELIGKHLGMFINRTEIDVRPVTVTMNMAGPSKAP